MTAKDQIQENLLQRAWVAYAKTDGMMAPGEGSAVVKLKGLPYVVLKNTAGATVAVFRIQGSGFLRRMRRPPAKLL